MRNVLITLLAVGLAASAAHAAAAQRTPGWYQVEDSVEGYFVLAGPFADEATCRATLPPSKDWYDYLCKYLPG